MVSASDSQPQDRGFESRQSQSAHQNRPAWATGGDNGASVHSTVNEYLALDRDGNALYLDYPWRLEACERVYTPRGVEQVTDVTGLPGVIICKAL